MGRADREERDIRLEYWIAFRHVYQFAPPSICQQSEILIQELRNPIINRGKGYFQKNCTVPSRRSRIRIMA